MKHSLAVREDIQGDLHSSHGRPADANPLRHQLPIVLLCRVPDSKRVTVISFFKLLPLLEKKGRTKLPVDCIVVCGISPFVKFASDEEKR